MAKQAKRLTRAEKIAAANAEQELVNKAKAVGLSKTAALFLLVKQSKDGRAHLQADFKTSTGRKVANSVIQAQSAVNVNFAALIEVETDRAFSTLQSIDATKRTIASKELDKYSPEEEFNSPDHEGNLERLQYRFDQFPMEIQQRAQARWLAEQQALKLQMERQDQANALPAIDLTDEDIFEWVLAHKPEGVEPLGEKGYCGERYWIWEDQVLKPKLEELGFLYLWCYDIERDSCGPLVRGFEALRLDENKQWRKHLFCYG